MVHDDRFGISAPVGRGSASIDSKDLRHWEYLHVLVSGEPAERNATHPVASGDMWECPELFPLGAKHVLIFSTQGKTHWKVGELDLKEMLFHPEKEGILDYGSDYAAKTQLDANGQRILWGWILEARPLEGVSRWGLGWNDVLAASADALSRWRSLACKWRPQRKCYGEGGKL